MAAELTETTAPVPVMPRVTSRRSKRTRMLAHLVQAGPGGLSTGELVALLGEADRPRNRALTDAGGKLRDAEADGLVTRAGRTQGGWSNKPSVVWAVTDTGRAWSGAHEAAAAQAEAAVKLRAIRASTRKAAQASVAASISGREVPADERRALARGMRSQGCTLQEIGDVFGVKRETIRIDLLPASKRKKRLQVNRTRYREHAAAK